MTRSRPFLLGALLGSAFTVGSFGIVACAKSDPDKGKARAGSAVPAQSEKELGEVLAEIDGVTITVGDFQDRINKQSPYIRARYTSLERKKEFLDNLVRFEVLAREAQKRGYDQDPEVVRTMKQVMIQKLMREEFETRVKPEDVTEAEMRKFYQDHFTDYNKPEEVRVSAIRIKDRKLAEKVAAEAKGPKGRDNKGFRDLVAAHSEDELSKIRGGDLRYFPADSADVPAAVAKAAFALAKTGDVAGPIETPDGFYVIKQTGRRKALSKSFDDVKRQIQNRLYRDKRTQAMEDFVGGLRKQAAIKIHEDRLARVRVDVTGGAEAGGHGGHLPPGGDPHDGLDTGDRPPGMPPRPAGMAPGGHEDNH
jgi:peptidyl-prolyl cis-trans isomerase C